MRAYRNTRRQRMQPGDIARDLEEGERRLRQGDIAGAAKAVRAAEHRSKIAQRIAALRRRLAFNASLQARPGPRKPPPSRPPPRASDQEHTSEECARRMHELRMQALAARAGVRPPLE